MRYSNSVLNQSITELKIFMVFEPGNVTLEPDLFPSLAIYILPIWYGMFGLQGCDVFPTGKIYLHTYCDISDHSQAEYQNIPNMRKCYVHHSR